MSIQKKLRRHLSDRKTFLKLHQSIAESARILTMGFHHDLLALERIELQPPFQAQTLASQSRRTMIGAAFCGYSQQLTVSAVPRRSWTVLFAAIPLRLNLF